MDVSPFLEAQDSFHVPTGASCCKKCFSIFNSTIDDRSDVSLQHHAPSGCQERTTASQMLVLSTMPFHIFQMKAKVSIICAIWFCLIIYDHLQSFRHSLSSYQKGRKNNSSSNKNNHIQPLHNPSPTENPQPTTSN